MKNLPGKNKIISQNRLHKAVRVFIVPAFIAAFSGQQVSAQQLDPLVVVGNVADKVIRDTRFQLKMVPQEEQLGMQVIDFRFLKLEHNNIAYAAIDAFGLADTTVYFGITSSGGVRLWLNKQPVFSREERATAAPVEFAYGRFRFANGFPAKIKKGRNEFLVRFERGKQDPAVIFLRPVTANSDLDTLISFGTGRWSAQWLYAGPFSAVSNTGTPEEEIRPYYNSGGSIVNWQAPPRRFLSELVTDSSAAYQRDPYADWQYAHGSMVWTILALGEVAERPAYIQFVKQYTNFILQHLDYFRWQYDSLFAYRGSYHRIFRRTMLDDAGAPALPFSALYERTKDASYKRILDPVIDYLSHRQVRLPDGTFCRPEPVEFTIWADDLFMSVPLLLEMAKATGNNAYYDDAASQAVNFHKYLCDEKTGLYKHGWFSKTGKRSEVYWGRANGWVAWATAELLQKLPVQHPLYKTILRNFRQHMASLARVQSPDGMWYQVLDNPSSYEETSCTAMFTLAMARGVRMGWISNKYAGYAKKGWKAVAQHITSDGVVHGICRGTEIGPDQQFYMNRKTFDNDPRGLGAVITAGIEISRLK